LFTEIPLILGADNRKMSKSSDNHIPIDYSDKDTEARVRTFITDPQKLRKNDPGRPEICPVYLLHRVYTADHAEEIAPNCRSGQLGCVDCKLRAAKSVNASLAPIREKRADLLTKPEFVWEVLDDGARRARDRAQEVMGRVRASMNMNYRESGS